ncbi:MAG: hypothetical protein ACI9X0_000341 [Kiritimatiellia bacterium]|jgi:hypothetical protein
MRNIFTKVKRVVRNISPTDRSVDFLICGTQKGGTTALDAYLREHPQICMADKKELHFFDKESNFIEGKPDYSKYHSWFGPQKAHKLMGESTPIYLYWKDAPKRIWDYNPDIKLIVLLRNPIERAYSHWSMMRSKNKDDASFLSAIENEKVRCREALPRQHRVYSYIDRGFYLVQLRRLWQHFPTDQTLILKNEYLKEHPINAIRDVCDFLGADQLQSIEAKNVHSRSYKSKMNEKERAYLRSVFEDEIRDLERVLDWDCSDWLA